MGTWPVAAAWYTLVTAALWGVVLPGVLVADQGDGVALRGAATLLPGVVIALAGVGLILAGARSLASRGVPLFGVTPGPVLVTDGWYGRIRNPIDAGATLLAFAAWMILAVDLMWVVPAAALVGFTVGSGLYEDRRLGEVFGDDFTEYRTAVAKWVPRRR